MNDRGRKERDFRQDQRIDRFRLELESERLPEIVKYWNDKWAQAKADVRTFTNRLAVKTAELEKEKNLAKGRLEAEAGLLRKKIRNDPKSFGVKEEALKKLTDTLLESIVIEQEAYKKVLKEFEDARAYVASEEHQKMSQDLADAKKRRDYAQGAVKAIEQKGFSINVLKDLLIHGFYAMAGKEVPEDKQVDLTRIEQIHKLTDEINARKKEVENEYQQKRS